MVWDVAVEGSIRPQGRRRWTVHGGSEDRTDLHQVSVDFPRKMVGKLIVDSKAARNRLNKHIT